MAKNYLIRNCKAEDFDYACPKRWSELEPSFSAAVRHCSHCNRKVYLCQTDADVAFYSSVNFCIAIAAISPDAEKEKGCGETPKTIEPENKRDAKVRLMGIYVQTAHRAAREMNTDDIPAFLKKDLTKNDDKK